jgi:putative serine protease PepD
MPGDTIEVQSPTGLRTFEAPGPVTFGREEGNDVVCDSPAVSRHHASLEHDGQGWLLRDAGSANGVFVNGARVSEQRISGPTVVRLGPADGGVEVSLTPGAAPAAAPPPPDAPPAAAPPPPGGATPPPPGGATPPRPSGAAPPPAGGPTPPPVAAPPPGPGPNETIDIRSLGVGSGAPPLAVVANGKRREFPASQAVSIGRDAGNDIVLDDDLVSSRHVVVAYQQGSGWTATDSSRNGTYVDGRRLTAPYRIERKAVLSLGAATGAEVELAPILSDAEAAKLDRAEGRKRRTKVMALATAAVIVIAAVVVGLVFGLKGNGTQKVNGLPVKLLNNAKLATVQIIASSGGTSQSSWEYTGSGSIVTSDGIILTNAHVGEPEAPGLAVAYGPAPGGLGTNPKVLFVAVTPKPDAPPEIKYRAKLVNADGYLDFAVLKIYADKDGNKIDTSKLNLPTLKTRSVTDLDIGDHVTTIGFPDLSQNFTKFVPASVADGKINTFVPDVYGRVDNSRYQIVTDADIKHGNSGGAAIDDKGELVAVPSAGLPGEGSDISKRLRSVDLAFPMIKAAENGSDYESPYSTAGTGKEELVGYQVTSSEPKGCQKGEENVDLQGGSKKFYVQLAMTGMRKGEDLVLVIGKPGSLGQDPSLLNSSPVTRWKADGSSGCQTVEVDLSLPDSGEIGFAVLGGTQLKQLSDEFDAEIG